MPREPLAVTRGTANVIRIHTLGGLTVRGSDGKPLSGSAIQPRRLAILALLARAGDRGVSRERILSLLWPDADDERGPRALAQALYALRKDLGIEDVICRCQGSAARSGARFCRRPRVLRPPSREATMRRAAALYSGPFLDGFHLSGAEEFSRWVDVERQRARARLHAVARIARSHGAGPWKRVRSCGVVAKDHGARSAQRAIHHGPDGVTLRLRRSRRRNQAVACLPAARRTRARPAAGQGGHGARGSTARFSRSSTNPDERIAAYRSADSNRATCAICDRSSGRAGRGHRSRVETAWWNVTRGSLDTRRCGRVIVVAIVIGAAARGSRATRLGATESVRQAGASTDGRVVAIGQITSYGTDSVARALAGPVSDLLSTSLARASGIRVVSRGRLFELMHSASGSGALDTSAGGFVNAARRAGGTEIVDGTVFVRPDGRLRLDLRRVDLASGAIGDVHTVEGSDLFALVDSGTARLVTAFGARGPFRIGR